MSVQPLDWQEKGQKCEYHEQKGTALMSSQCAMTKQKTLFVLKLYIYY
jgi:hypothetical protein